MRWVAVLVVGCFVMIPLPGLCEDLTDEKKNAIIELLDVTGASKLGVFLGNIVADETIRVLKKTAPDIDPRAFEIIREESKLVFYEEFAVKKSLYPYMYPIYHKHLTLAEMKGLIEFYKTPLGQKAVSVMPKMSHEGALAGQKWAETITPDLKKRIKDRLNEEGIEYPK